MLGETLPEKVKRALNELGAKVYVLVWGPGEKALPHWYDKRLKVIAYLQGLNKNYEVWTSEDIEDTLPGGRDTDAEVLLEAGSREIVHAREADLIVALVLGPPEKQPGIYRELQLVSSKRELREKTYIFLPDQKTYLKRFSSGVIKNFREDHIFPLPWADLKECDKIRSRCSFLAKQELNQKLLDTMNSSF